MMLKTHLAISAFFVILIIPFASHPLALVIMSFIGTVFPDIDTRFSRIGRNFISRVLQFATKHRGMIHSITLCIALSLLLAVFLPVLSLGFFLGYSIHIFSDSFTKAGITPFWPYKKESKGFITTGKNIEKTIFFVFIFADFALLVARLLAA